MGIYELSIKRPFTNFKRLIAGFLWNILPIVNFVALGYALRCGKLSMKNNFEMPAWNKKGELFTNGLLAFLISIIYMLPFIIVMFLGFMPVFRNVDFTRLQEQTYLLDLMKQVVIYNLVLVILVSILFLLAIYIMPSAIMNFITKNNFNAAFEFLTVFRKAFTSKYFVTALLMSIYGFALYFLLGFIPLVGRILATFLIYVTSYSAYGAIYNKL